jgi:DHA1 family bicyclomycin/chloramphenicol resistance-like MFS transporter
MTSTLSLSLLIALAAIGILGPFGTDIYLPALPNMADELNVVPVTLQLTFTAFTFGMAFGQIVFGPLSDKFGRRIFILGSSALTVFISAWAALAESAVALITACGLMGLAAAGCRVTANAVVSDLATGREANRGFSLLGMMIGIGPILAPVGGAIAMNVGGSWRSIFWSLAIYASIVTATGYFFVPETLKPGNRHSGGFASLVKAGGRILKNPIFLAYSLTMVFSFGAVFGYISYSSYIVQEILGWSTSEYAVIFAINGIFMTIAGLIGAQISKTWDPRSVLVIALAMNGFGAVGVLLVALTNSPTSQIVLPLLALMASSMGFLFGPATTMALIQVRQNAGTALALSGAAQFVAAGISAVLVGIENSNQLLPFGLVVAILSVLAIVSAWWGSRASRQIEI